MSRCRSMLPVLVLLAGGALVSARQAPPRIASPDRVQVLDTMKRATGFMLEKVATRGGYVWTYLPDLSRRWGEIEARPSMIWLQPPGTPTMGHLFLDAYHATGDEYYYRAAEDAAGALILAQHPSGGWNYVFDTAGEAELRRLVQHGRPQRVAPRGIPARLGQCHLRRWRDVAVRPAPAAPLPRKA